MPLVWRQGPGFARIQDHAKHPARVRNPSTGPNLRLVVEITFADGLPESYLLPVTFADENTTTRLLAETPQAVLVRLEGQQSLCDALYLPEPRAALLRR